MKPGEPGFVQYVVTFRSVPQSHASKLAAWLLDVSLVLSLDIRGTGRAGSRDFVFSVYFAPGRAADLAERFSAFARSFQNEITVAIEEVSA